MKYFLLLALAACASQTTDQKPARRIDPLIADCRQFSREVLRGAVFVDSSATAGDQEDRRRFVADEKLARQSLEAFDLRRLGFRPGGLKEWQDFRRESCRTHAMPDSPPYCENMFDILNYFRALNYGMSHNKWSAATKQLARDKFRGYVETTRTDAKTVVDLMIVSTLILEWSEAKNIQSPAPKDARSLNQRINAEALKLEKYARLADHQACREIDKISAQESEVFAKIQTELQRQTIQ